MLLDEIPLGFARTVAIVFGLLWGSFLNVVIYRVPLGMSVVKPPSHCPSCGKPVKPYDNVPLLSFLILRGRTRCCNTKMSVRYPIVEMLGGLAAWAVFDAVVRSLPGDTPALRVAALFCVELALALGLIAAAFIDAEHMFLPDEITIGGMVLGFATASLRGMTFVQSGLGAAIGFAVIWVPFIAIYKAVRGYAGMGHGDAKLLALAGAWFGWPGVLFVLFGGAMQGSVGTILLYLFKGKLEEPESVKKDREELQKASDAGDEEAKQLLEDDPVLNGSVEGKPKIPFGPFLILACLECLLAGDWLLSKVASLLVPGLDS